MRRQKLCGAVRHNDHVVFAAHAKFADNVDARFIRKSHARFEIGRAAFDEIGMLVPIEADAVSQAMSEIFIAWAVTGFDDDGASGIIHGAGKPAFASGVQCGVLRFTHEFVCFRDFF